MKLKLKQIGVLSTLALLFSFRALAAVETGVWTSDFSEAKSRADNEHIPMLVFWGNPGCAYCKKMKKAFTTDEFTKWQNDRQILMVKVEGDEDVKNFVKNSSGDYPFICVYWNKAQGSTITKKFTGRKGKMPITKGTLAKQLIDSVELYIADYNDYNGGEFLVSNTSVDQLEAEVGLTTYVDIPMTREVTGIATNLLVISEGTNKITNKITWAKDQTAKAFRYTLPEGFKAGKRYARLYTADGKKFIDKNTIVCTNRANSISYPYWLGERTAETLNYGEWTMDLDVAKAKVAAEAGNAYTLVNVGGDLWCPYCQGVAQSLYADTAFTEWAKSKKVALVSIDQPRAGTQQASLLTYVEDSKGVSGAFYRSSKMIDDAAAQAVIARNEQFSFRDYLLPSTGASRIANPTALLFNKAGEIVGRLNPRRDADKNYSTEENLARLNELLAMADAGKTGESHKDSSTTTLTHTVGASSDMTMQVNDSVRFYKLDGLAAGKVSFNTTAASGNSAVTLELFTSPSGSYGDKNKNLLASATNTVTVALDAATIASNVYLRVETYSNAIESDIFSSASTSSLFDVTVTSTLILMPEEVGQTVTLGTTSVAMEITEGNLYKLSGFDTTSLATYFTTSNDLYVAKETNATAMLDLASGASEVSYQLWKPGCIQFAQASDRKMEMDGSGTITVTRTGGKSGAITVNVSVDDGGNDTKRVSLSQTTLTWEEGDTKAKTINYTIQQISGFNKDEIFTLMLAADDETMLGEPKTFALTVSDTDKPVLGSDAFTVNAFVLAKEEGTYDVFNIQGNGTLTLKKAGSLPSGMKIAYDKKTRKVVLSGTPKKTGTYKTTITLKERRNGKYEAGPATTFTIVVRDPSSATSMAGYGVANAYYGKSLSQTLPLINSENKRMEGLLTLAISKANRVSAKYTNLNNKKTSFSGAVNGYDPTEGYIESQMSKSGSLCAVSLSSDGRLSVEIYDDSRDVTLKCPELDISATANTAVYAGTYTVTFPRADTNVASVAAGTAYATLKISTKGTATYSGVMPNGTTFSGSAKIIAGEDVALVPVFRTSKSGMISALLNVLPDAKEQYENNNPAIILAEEGTIPFWSCTKGIATEEELKAYGGYYAKTLNFEDICVALYEKNAFTLDLDVDALDWAGSATSIASVPQIEVSFKKSSFVLESVKGVSFTKSSSTGVVSGKVPLTLANGKTLKANFKGIVLVGWEDCNCGDTPIVPENRPFVSGTCYFTDTVNGVRVTRSIPIDLNVQTDCEE